MRYARPEQHHRLGRRLCAGALGGDAGLGFCQAGPRERQFVLAFLFPLELPLNPLAHGLRFPTYLLAALQCGALILGPDLPGALGRRVGVRPVGQHDAAIRRPLLVDVDLAGVGFCNSTHCGEPNGSRQH